MNDHNFAHLTLILLLHYLVKCRGLFWTFTTMNCCRVPHAGSENHCETRKSLKICYFFNINQEQVYCTKISDVDELKRHVNSEWVALSHTDWMCCWRVVQRLRTCVPAGGGHFEPHTVIKIMWCDTCDLFWETITASRAIVCCHSVNHSNIHLIIVLTAQSDTSNFPR